MRPWATLVAGLAVGLPACAPTPPSATEPTAQVSAALGSGRSWVERDSFTLRDNHDPFGYYVGLDRDLAVVSDAVGVYTFVREGSGWRGESAPAASEKYDSVRDLAVSRGAVARIFSRYEDQVPSLALHEREGETLTLGAELTRTELGYAQLNRVALGDEWLLLAASDAEFADHVLAFERSASGLGAPSIVTSSVDEIYDLSLAVSGDSLLVGMPYVQADNGSEGVVRVYERSDKTWQESATLAAPDSDTVGFGISLAATNNHVIVGTATGQAYVFAHQASGFGAPTRLDPPSDVVERAGSVSISDDVALVGLPDAQQGVLERSGAAYMAFRVDDTWRDTVWLERDVVLAQARFGWRVSVGETEALVSAPGELRPHSSGKVFAYGGCTADSDCASDSYCNAHAACEVHKPLGSPCEPASECLTDNCGLCASGQCVDGYCCDRPCEGDCEACAEPGLKGECSAVVGTPRGDRPACAGDDSECAGYCDGKSPACRFAPRNLPCDSACEAGLLTPSSCDGAGICVAGALESCGGFGCDGDACGVSCQRAEDCVDGFACIEQSCVPVSELACSDDGATSIGPTGTTLCEPYRCDDERGVCATSCDASRDCASGYVCDSRQRACVTESTTETNDDGCGCRLTGGQRGTNARLAVLAALAISLGRRRKAKS